MISEKFLRGFGRGLLLMAVLISGVGYPYTGAVQAEEATSTSSTSSEQASLGQAVYLVVELYDASGFERELRRNVRSGIREIRRVSERLPRDYEIDGEKKRASDLRRYRVIEVAASEADQVAADLKNSPAVASVRIENIYEMARSPNDPLFSDQWALANNPLADIRAPAAWERTTGSSNTVIAVIDGGVDLNHEDLRSKIWQNGGEVGGNGRDDDGNGYVDDVNGWDFVEDTPAGYAHDHGTHVAGLAAASSNNGIGVAGVDWGARIMSVRVLNRSGLGREEWVVRGIEYAVENGADVINLSIVGGPSAAIGAAIENAYAAGVVVVAAAGNSRLNTDGRSVYPVCADGGADMVLGVGALDQDGDRSSFSNYGQCVNVAAPGKRLLSTTTGNRYRDMTGTSMSAPLAAGVAGLYLAANPGASPAQVIAAITGADGGKLSAAKALGIDIDRGSPPLPTPDGGATARQGEPVLAVEMTGPATATPGASVQYEVRVSNSGGAAEGVSINGRFDRDLSFVPGSSSSGCVVDGREVTCGHGKLGAQETASFSLLFQLAGDARCGSRLREDVSVYAEERGRSRRQERSERVASEVSCTQ